MTELNASESIQYLLKRIRNNLIRVYNIEVISISNYNAKNIFLLRMSNFGWRCRVKELIRLMSTAQS